MNEQKRFFLFLMISFLTMFGLQIALEQAGYFPKPDPEAKAKADAAKKAADTAIAPPIKTAETKPGDPAKASVTAPPKEIFKEEKVELGSTDPQSGFRLKLNLSNRGAGIVQAESSVFTADHLPGQDIQDKLKLIQSEPASPDSLTLEIRNIDGEEKPINLANINWEIVREKPDAKPVTIEAETEKVAFRHVSTDVPGLTITKTFQLTKGRDDVGMKIKLESAQDHSVTYRLLGPYGLPLEGQWYSYTYRDLFFAPTDIGSSLISRTSANVAKSSDPSAGYPAEQVTIPIRFAGVETQYFADFIEMKAEPGSESNWIAEATERLVGPVPVDPNNSNITVSLTTKPVRLAPNTPVTHEYSVFLGSKTKQNLTPYNAIELTTYRRGWAVPGSRLLARSFISPLLDTTYAATKSFFGLFGAKRGSYGVAIILLTAVVRSMIFPLSRKQAITAKRMQELAPQMASIKEKYKDDRERQGRETMDLYKQAGVNPFSGCLIAMIQLPVFMGLWQTLNNSVALRHAPFLYIDNLAAPDALFKFPQSIPFLGDYFNILPLVSVILMYIQMKLFSPPPANEEAEMQQKMFSVMMVFMSFMFYKVPSGLGLYFITSSLWALGERLLLPKLVKSGPALVLSSDSGAAASSSSRSSPKDTTTTKPATGWRAKWQQLLEEADKQRTIQNDDKRPGQSKGGGKDRPNRGKR
jgi:YidC/Oxa1 family membrane protein insertase